MASDRMFTARSEVVCSSPSLRLSKKHKDQPWGMDVHGSRHEVGYWPGDSLSGMFGGNSNWRGPIWLAVNFLLIESLQRFYQYYGEDIQVGAGDVLVSYILRSVILRSNAQQEAGNT
jgi:hypothetical protein